MSGGRNYLSPLEVLLSPSPEPQTIVFGSALPQSLEPEIAEHSGAIDVAILAPSSSECADAQWLASSIADIEGRAGRDAVVYLLAPVRYRLAIVRRLRQDGWRYSRSVLHVPSISVSRYIAEVSRSPMTYLIREAAAAFPFRGIARRAAAAPALALEAVIPAVPAAGLVFRRGRTGNPPAIAGSFSYAGAVVRTNWRGMRHPVTSQLFDSRSAAPLCVGKMRLNHFERHRTLDEAAAIECAAAAPRSSDVRIPQLLARGGSDRFPVLYQTALPGPLAARVLQQRPGSVQDICERIGVWLQDWNRTTAVQGVLTRDAFEQHIVQPAQRLTGELTEGTAYAKWLTNTFSEAVGAPFVFTDAHNDLTMRNVTVAADGKLGIIDWEEYRSASLPFVDLFYAVADAVAATSGYRDRAAVIRDAFTHSGRHASWVRPLIAAAAGAIHADPSAAALAFHACWLHHASNEQKLGRAERPFLAVLNSAAFHRRDIAGYLGFNK